MTSLLESTSNFNPRFAAVNICHELFDKLYYNNLCIILYIYIYKYSVVNLTIRQDKLFFLINQ